MFDRAVAFGVLQEVGLGVATGMECRATFPWARPCGPAPEGTGGRSDTGGGSAEYGSRCAHWDGDGAPSWCFCRGCTSRDPFLGAQWEYCTNQSSVACPWAVFGSAAWEERRTEAERHMCCAVEQLLEKVKPAGGRVGILGVMDESCRFHPRSWLGRDGVYLGSAFWSRCLGRIQGRLGALAARRVSYVAEAYCPSQYSVVIRRVSGRK